MCSSPSPKKKEWFAINDPRNKLGYSFWLIQSNYIGLMVNLAGIIEGISGFVGDAFLKPLKIKGFKPMGMHSHIWKSQFPKDSDYFVCTNIVILHCEASRFLMSLFVRKTDPNFLFSHPKLKVFDKFLRYFDAKWEIDDCLVIREVFVFSCVPRVPCKSEKLWKLGQFVGVDEDSDGVQVSPKSFINVTVVL